MASQKVQSRPRARRRADDIGTVTGMIVLLLFAGFIKRDASAAPRLPANRPAIAAEVKAPPVAPTPRIDVRHKAIATALATAHKLIGRPYQYGARGPNAFDCSGFTSFVWRAAGLEIPRRSADQFSLLPRVELDKLKPGDLVYSLGHIGMYVGYGNLIHSPHSGRTVAIEPLYSDVVGAVRPARMVEDKTVRDLVALGF